MTTVKILLTCYRWYNAGKMLFFGSQREFLPNGKIVTKREARLRNRGLIRDQLIAFGDSAAITKLRNIPILVIDYSRLLS